MLRELRVRDLAVIDNVTVQFVDGLNVLTGETGAGKSILIDAVLLLRGARAHADAIRSDCEVARVEGLFAVAPQSAAADILGEAGLAPEDGEIVVRRELSRSGRHRAFINDSPATVALLERLGEHLVEVHGQQEHQRLAQAGPQLAILDRFAGLEVMADRVAAIHAQHREACADVARLGAAERDRAQREDLLRFQVSELDAARLRPGEEEDLRAERQRLHHAERILAGLAEAETQLDEEPGSARARVGRAIRALRELGRLESGSSAPAEALEGVAALLDESLRAVRALRQGIAVDPARLEEAEERWEVIARLKRKYGDSVEAMLAFREAAAADLERLSHHDQELAEQERRRARLHADLETAAGELSDGREAAAGRLGSLVEREIRELGMDHGLFRVALEPLSAVAPRGRDRVEFRLAANPGEEPKALARVASGGELSRTMLALLAVLAAADSIPTVIFDEVDTGIGGQVAAVVGDRLGAVAARRQVLCVTHLAQVAARARHHLRVTKSVRAGRARAAVEVLGGEARVAEIARMLGGDTPAALRHARDLLAAGRPARR